MRIHFKKNTWDHATLCGAKVPRKHRHVHVTTQVSFVDCQRCMKMIDLMMKSGKRVRSKT